MKIDKDFVLKYGNHTFKAEEIETIKISNGWINMETIEKDGMVTQLNAELKDVEFLSIPNIPDFKRTMSRDTTPNTARQCEMYRYGCFYAPPHGSRRDDTEMVIPLDIIRRAVQEAAKEYGKYLSRKAKHSGGD